MLQLIVVFVSIEDMADLYSFVLFVYRVNNTEFPLVNTEPFKTCIREIL